MSLSHLKKQIEKYKPIYVYLKSNDDVFHKIKYIPIKYQDKLHQIFTYIQKNSTFIIIIWYISNINSILGNKKSLFL